MKLASRTEVDMETDMAKMSCMAEEEAEVVVVLARYVDFGRQC